MKKIYSILVAYNPILEELDKSIKRLKKQTNFIVICNNSNYDLNFNDNQIKVFNFKKNLGIAQAQNIGMEWAFNNGADFILQIDQDSIPHNDLIVKLLECYEYLTKNNLKVGLIGVQDYDKDTKQLSKPKFKKEVKLKDTNYVLVNQILSSGSLIPKSTYKFIGGMENDLFIDIVDFEYCWRLKKNGLLIVKNNDALLAHKIGNGSKKILYFFNVGLPNPIRHYYQNRNSLLLLNRNYVPNYWKISTTVKIIIKLFIFPFVLDDGLIRFKYMLRGLKDGILRKKGILNNNIQDQNESN